MSRLTEKDIFSTLHEVLGEAAQCARNLASEKREGPTYVRFRECLALAEGCCRQAAMWRGDSRWLPIGVKLHELHDRAGSMLRGWKPKGSEVQVQFPLHEKNQLFIMVADILEAFRKGVVVELQTRKTGVSGVILPYQPAPERRAGTISMSGLILPPRLRKAV